MQVSAHDLLLDLSVFLCIDGIHFLRPLKLFISSSSLSFRWDSAVVSESMSSRISTFRRSKLFSSSSCTVLFRRRWSSFCDPVPPDSAIHWPFSNLRLCPAILILGEPYSKPSSTSFVVRSSACKFESDADFLGGVFFGLKVFPKRGILPNFQVDSRVDRRGLQLILS